MLLSLEGRTLWYDDLGPVTAPAVVLIHPLAADSGIWAEQLPALLVAGYRVIRADLRGHGGSAAQPGPYAMEDLVSDYLALIDHLGVERAHFCGISIGGMISEGMAILHPERVISLMLGNTRAVAPADAATRWGPRIAQVEAEGSLVPLADATMSRWLSEACRAARPLLWQQIHDTVAAASVSGYAGCAAAIQGFDWRLRLAEIAQPVLVVCGADDKGSDIGENEMIAKTVRNGRFRPIENARHLPNAEDPALFNSLLIDWLSRNAG